MCLSVRRLVAGAPICFPPKTGRCWPRLWVFLKDAYPLEMCGEFAPRPSGDYQLKNIKHGAWRCQDASENGIKISEEAREKRFQKCYHAHRSPKMDET